MYVILFLFILFYWLYRANIEKFESSTRNRIEYRFRLPKYESLLLKLNIKYAIFPFNNGKTNIRARFVRARIELGLIISMAGGKDRSTHSAIGLCRELRAIGSATRITSTFLHTERSINVPTKQKRRNDIIYRHCATLLSRPILLDFPSYQICVHIRMYVYFSATMNTITSEIFFLIDKVRCALSVHFVRNFVYMSNFRSTHRRFLCKIFF